ncbi:hypothetical protein [Actinocrispum wychmicini]|uniref:DUF4367 domain-containing protein n=1 Tax=Actinocrispum wychmicini TaxID=1213861 RepID=A0A4R2K092_9PSEU|nr:hypothetical protein [Actinocrispum wychmicini]TCO63009.1 hypothetical protein EV192_1021153 [Actinocrispum wychmicini]
MTDDQLEAALRDLGTHIDVPDTPDVTASVTARLSVRERRTWKLRPVLTTVLALLLAFALALAVSPDVRAGVSHLLRFAGIEFRSDPPPPITPAPTTTATPTLAPGERVVPLDEARGKFPVIVPKALGQPNEVHVTETSVSLLYDNARVDEFNGGISMVMAKFVTADQLERIKVNGVDGYWVNGPHEVIYDDPRGYTRTGTARMSAKTLIWQVGTTTLRLEGDFTRERAVSIAENG